MRKNTIFCILAAISLFFSTIGTTQATWKIVSDSVHVIDTAGVKAQIVEEYNQTADIYPGNVIDKVVNVKNTGNSDSIVRVQVEKAWGEKRGKVDSTEGGREGAPGYADGKLIANDTCSTDNIIIEYNTGYWVYDASDGYFYYKDVLKPGQTTRAPLFREFSIDKNTGNAYMGLEADIKVKMECVQAAAGGILVWNKTFEDLGIVYTADEPGDTIASVTFAGKVNSTESGRGGALGYGDDEFVFDPDNADLFIHFKNLVPGETRNQIIEVKNTFETNTGVEIFLRAENISQKFSDPGTLALVDKLLREYAVIIVTGESGNVIYNGPVWGEPSSDYSNPESMRYDISLGKFMTDEGRKLNIQLQLDPVMGNEYQNLQGLIKWVWSAKDDDNIPPLAEDYPRDTPRTGDNYNLWLWVVFMAISTLIFVILLRYGAKSKKHDRRLV